MKRKKKALIIGPGNIGRALRDRLENAPGWDTPRVLDGMMAKSLWPRPLHGIDLVFLAIPTKDDGRIALRYLADVTRRDIYAVTCEKGALANHFGRLHRRLRGIGVGATVGGGSGIIDFLKHRVNARTQEVHAVVNGTLNFIWDGLSAGNPLGHVVSEAKKLGYAEPGEQDPLGIIRGEADGDVTKKAAILFNLCFAPSAWLRAKDISVDLTAQKIGRAISESRSRRFIVSFQKGTSLPSLERDPVVAFRHEASGWTVTGSFRSLEDPFVARLSAATPGVNNGVLTVQGEQGADGIGLCVGLGAGPAPTTAAMIHDAERLLGMTGKG